MYLTNSPGAVIVPSEVAAIWNDDDDDDDDGGGAGGGGGGGGGGARNVIFRTEITNTPVTYKILLSNQELGWCCCESWSFHLTCIM